MTRQENEQPERDQQLVADTDVGGVGLARAYLMAKVAPAPMSVVHIHALAWLSARHVTTSCSTVLR